MVAHQAQVAAAQEQAAGGAPGGLHERPVARQVGDDAELEEEGAAAGGGRDVGLEGAPRRRG